MQSNNYSYGAYIVLCILSHLEMIKTIDDRICGLYVKHHSVLGTCCGQAEAAPYPIPGTQTNKQTNKTDSCNGTGLLKKLKFSLQGCAKNLVLEAKLTEVESEPVELKLNFRKARSVALRGPWELEGNGC